MPNRTYTNIAWLALGAALAAYCVVLSLNSERFGYSAALIDMPILELVGFGALAGLAYLLLPKLITSARTEDAGTPNWVVIWILLAGLIMRVVFLGSTPIIEDDNQRYLWDGAVTANGFNPFTTAPLDVQTGTATDTGLLELGDEAGPLLQRINYPQIRTVYPVVAQAAFALAYWLKPFSLDAWRAVILVSDLAIAAFVVLLLQSLGRPLPWLALYWWNPVVVKELHNSAHMDVLVVLAVTAAVWFAVRHRTVASAIALALGFGAKLWPLLLVPTLARRILSQPAKLIVPGLLCIALCAAFLAPVVLARLDDTSGFVAYGGEWQANDALFRGIEWVVIQLLEIAGLESHGRIAARILVGCILIAIILFVNRTSPKSARDICWRVFITISALLLLSPTQFPWYFCWLAPFLPLFPVRGFLTLAVTLPLDYLYFFLAPRGHEVWFHYGVVLLIWAPVWVLLAMDALRNERREQHPDNALSERA